jgi:hypothetical protein
MVGRTALLIEWLEGEGERQRSPIQLPPQVGDPSLRGWVHVAVCTLGGVLATALFVCWLDTVWGQSVKAAAVNEYRINQVEIEPGRVR